MFTHSSRLFTLNFLLEHWSNKFTLYFTAVQKYYDEVRPPRHSWMWQHGHGTDVEEHGASDNHRQDGGWGSSETIETHLANCTASHYKKTTTLTGPPWTRYHLLNILGQLGVNESERYTCYSSLTLLTRKSFSSKCRPNILGASPGMGSILMHTSCPFLALSTALWLLSMLVTTPKSTNWKNDTIKRQKAMKSSPNDIMEPDAFTHCHWLALWGSKTGSESIEVEWDPNTLTNTKGTVDSSESTIGRSSIAKAGVHKFQATKFCTLAPNICGSSIQSLFHVILLGPTILK